MTKPVDRILSAMSDVSVGTGIGMAPAKCPCAKCVAGRNEGMVPFMVLCPNCGNKRCPHATDHALGCTQSNEPGQQGSAYGPATLGKEASDG